MIYLIPTAYRVLQHRRKALIFIFSLLAILTSSHARNSAAETSHRFNRDVRPILAAACFKCHGQDPKLRQGDLRLDDSNSAYAVHEDGVAIAPGNRSQSKVWDRINSKDPDIQMPPPTSPRQLTDAEREIIGTWIDGGAQYEKHWSFEPIQTSEPETEATSSVIDRLVNLELADHGMTANEQADARTRLRRLSFTLTGLPPSVADAEAFAADPSPSNYETFVDKYLSSPHYGEEMAKHWLDLARYGDTHGLHLDNERQMWPYRDWVVTAFNDNKPFSDFTIEQIAGDLYPSPTQPQLVATGFNRCNVTTSEGGAIDDEFLYRYAVDRTSTMISTWMGLTGGCAVCHDHKYDPISAKEFYSLYAFYYSANDPAMDGNVDTTAPFLRLSNAAQQTKLKEARDRESAAKTKLIELTRSDRSKVPTINSDAAWTQILIDDEVPIGVSQRNTSRNETRWTDGSSSVPRGRRALITEFGDKYEQVFSGGMATAFVPSEAKLQFWVRLDANEPPQAIFVEIKTKGGRARWVWTDDPALSQRVDAQPDRVVGKLPIRGTWTELNAPVTEIAAGGDIEELKVGLMGGSCQWDSIALTGKFRDEDRERLNFRAWWAKRKGTNVQIAEGDVAKAIQEGPDSEFGKSHQNEVECFFKAFIAPFPGAAIAEARSEWDEARIRRRIIEDDLPGTMTFANRNEMRQSNIMLRGQYDQKGESVSPGVPAILPALHARSNSIADRMDLANWLVSNDHPLVARVAVNRFWQQVFGMGLVKTSEDFGTQGAPPSHPELLDSLAYRFRMKGWNVKQLMKVMVMSQAFQRSATVDPRNYSLDPENRWLARGPRLRLDAEQMRDNVLAVSGLLNRSIGGPGFRGYQPSNIWEPVGYGDSNTRYYIPQHGSTIYRRSLYAFIKRTAPPPFMSNFDAPNRETSCTRRERSNTPLQALQLLNDVQYVEAARFFAEHIVRTVNGSDDDRILAVFSQGLQRRPDEVEMSTLKRALTDFKSRFAQSPEDASKLLQVGDLTVDAALPSAEVAAFTLLCNLILNLDEMVTRN